MVGHTFTEATNPCDGKRHGGFYSHEEIREIVAYAAARGIHVLPEVDLPGHVQALVAAYPELGCSPEPARVRHRWGISPHVLNLEPATFKFIERLLDTLVELFPFRYVHLGGDEVLTGQWEQSHAVRERMQSLVLSSVQQVQPHLTGRFREMLHDRNLLLIGWDEILENGNLEPDIAVMFWRDQDAFEGKFSPLQGLERGHPVVLSNSSRTYFDHYQVPEDQWPSEPMAIGGCTTTEMVYNWNPLAKIPESFAAQILGIQGQVWTEYIPNRDHLDYMVFPRACALAQVAWTGAGRETWQDFQPRLDQHLDRLERLNVRYRRIENSQ